MISYLCLIVTAAAPFLHCVPPPPPNITHTRIIGGTYGVTLITVDSPQIIHYLRFHSIMLCGRHWITEFIWKTNIHCKNSKTISERKLPAFQDNSSTVCQEIFSKLARPA